MELIKLPVSLLGRGTDQTPPEMLLCDYITRPPYPKSRVILETNLLSFPLSGYKELYHYNSCYKTRGDDFVLVKSGHCVMSEKNSDEGFFRSVVFFFGDSILQEILIKHSLISPNRRTLKEPVLVLKYDAYIYDFLETLIHISHNTGPLSEKIKLIKLEEILLYLIERNGTEFLSFLNSSYLAPHEISLKTAVEKHLTERLSIEELAFITNMSVSTFKREFQKIYNSPPARWFQNKRLESAAIMLKTRRARPGSVYLDAGFESHSAFTKAFRLKFGLTPAEYQRQQI